MLWGEFTQPNLVMNFHQKNTFNVVHMYNQLFDFSRSSRSSSSSRSSRSSSSSRSGRSSSSGGRHYERLKETPLPTPTYKKNPWNRRPPRGDESRRTGGGPGRTPMPGDDTEEYEEEAKRLDR